MNLYIQIRNGQPFEHPILEDNLRQAFPNVDINNLPESFAKFNRIARPLVGVYELYEGVTYEWVDGVVQDVHYVRAMTAEEKLAKQNAAKAEWAEYGFASWTFNEETCNYDPPISYPTDDKKYRWDEPTTSWIEITA